MKWRSVDEKPKLRGYYFIIDESNELANCHYFVLGGNWPTAFKVKAWLDPEVPEEFLRPKAPEKRPCPWCKTYNWKIVKFGVTNQFYYVCEQKGCKAAGPERDTYAEAEAAIFERVK